MRFTRAGLIGAAVMIPVSNVFPSIFAFTNTFRSKMIDIKSDVKHSFGERSTTTRTGTGTGMLAFIGKTRAAPPHPPSPSLRLSLLRPSSRKAHGPTHTLVLRMSTSISSVLHCAGK